MRRQERREKKKGGRGEERRELQTQDGKGFRVRCIGQHLNMETAPQQRHWGRLWESSWSPEGRAASQDRAEPQPGCPASQSESSQIRVLRLPLPPGKSLSSM